MLDRFQTKWFSNSRSRILVRLSLFLIRFLRNPQPMNTNLPYWLAALYLPDVGPRKFLQWLPHFSDITAMFQASPDELYEKGIPLKYHHGFKKPNWQLVDEDLVWMTVAENHLISYEDAHYPKILKQIADPPLVLYVCGNKLALAQTQLAIVGSRHATCMGLKNAEQFAFHLAQVGLTITSGLAIGVDGASHRGALAADGMTIAVAGTGLKHIYPTRHTSLAGKIIAHRGALVSEFPLNMQAHAANFPRRNRIISGLSMGVVVVEAARKSGSLITAHSALEQGREVFAIPGSIHNPMAQGCHYLIQQGAKLVENVNDIFVELPALSHLIKTNEAKEKKPLLDKKTQNVLEMVGYETTSMDVIILRSRLTASEVSSILLALELKGYIQFVSGGYIRVG